MAANIDQNLLRAFDTIKDKDETIIWTGKPRFVPFALSGLWSGLIMIVFIIIWFVLSTQVKPENDDTGGWGRWLVLLPAVLLVSSFLKQLFSFRNTCYAYSNRRVMMRSGFIGISFKTIDYDKISDIEVTVNAVQKAYQVGTVKFFSGRTETNDGNTTNLYDNWESIANPYEVFRKVKEVIVDIKTDYNYPNALRPGINPGYHTTYDRKE